MNTTQFTALSPDEYKQNTQKHWSNAPCDSHYSQHEIGALPFFQEIEAERYRTHGWILENIHSFDLKGKQTLEIGFGMGADHVSLARRGAIMHGLDLTPRNLEVTEKHLALNGLTSNLVTGDAENMPFEDNSMDFVYSCGVIHHSPDTEKIISEIYRVLKPGGKCWIAVYNKNSIFFWWSLFLVGWIGHFGFRKETLKQRISRVEYPNDSPDLVIRLYKQREFARLFSAFREVETSVDHLLAMDFAVFGKWLSENTLKWLGKRFGWYVLLAATK